MQSGGVGPVMQKAVAVQARWREIAQITWAVRDARWADDVALACGGSRAAKIGAIEHAQDKWKLAALLFLREFLRGE